VDKQKNVIIFFPNISVISTNAPRSVISTNAVRRNLYDEHWDFSLRSKWQKPLLAT